jgi:hypothetical protein
MSSNQNQNLFIPFDLSSAFNQGCQIFLGEKYQNGKNIPKWEKYTKLPQNWM